MTDQQHKALQLADELSKLQPSLLPVMKKAAIELRRLHAEVEDLKLAEEGAKEAFGVVVLQKRELEATCQKQLRHIHSTNNLLREVILERDELLKVLPLPISSATA